MFLCRILVALLAAILFLPRSIIVIFEPTQWLTYEPEPNLVAIAGEDAYIYKPAHGEPEVTVYGPVPTMGRRPRGPVPIFDISKPPPELDMNGPLPVFEMSEPEPGFFGASDPAAVFSMPGFPIVLTSPELSKPSISDPTRNTRGSQPAHHVPVFDMSMPPPPVGVSPFGGPAPVGSGPTERERAGATSGSGMEDGPGSHHTPLGTRYGSLEDVEKQLWELYDPIEKAYHFLFDNNSEYSALTRIIFGSLSLIEIIVSCLWLVRHCTKKNSPAPESSKENTADENCAPVDHSDSEDDMPPPTTSCHTPSLFNRLEASEVNRLCRRQRSTLLSTQSEPTAPEDGSTEAQCDSGSPISPQTNPQCDGPELSSNPQCDAADVSASVAQALTILNAELQRNTFLKCIGKNEPLKDSSFDPSTQLNAKAPLESSTTGQAKPTCNFHPSHPEQSHTADPLNFNQSSATIDAGDPPNSCPDLIIPDPIECLHSESEDVTSIENGQEGTGAGDEVAEVPPIHAMALVTSVLEFARDFMVATT